MRPLVHGTSFLPRNPSPLGQHILAILPLINHPLEPADLTLDTTQSIENTTHTFVHRRCSIRCIHAQPPYKLSPKNNPYKNQPPTGCNNFLQAPHHQDACGWTPPTS